MKRFAMICLVMMLGASLALAQAQAQAQTKIEGAKPEAKGDGKATAALPTVDSILEKYVTALGGKAAIEKLNSRTAKGTFELPAMGASGTFEMSAKAPNKTAMKIEIPGFGEIHNRFDGVKAWSQDPMSGLRELSGVELAATKLDADFYKDIKMKELYKQLAVKGKEKVGSGEAYVVEATPAEGAPEKYYFDATTGLLVRHDTERDSPQGKMAVESTFEDYRVVDGVQVVHTIKQSTPAFAMVIKMSEVKHNVAVDDAKFAKPSGQ